MSRYFRLRERKTEIPPALVTALGWKSDEHHAHPYTYAPIGEGVTNGDSHDHSGGDGAQIDHGGLAGLSDDDHTQYTKKATLTEQGDIYYAAAASTPAALAHGNAGDILQSGGHGANPSWLAGSTYAIAAKGVTNGDSHDHSGGDGAQIAYSGLSGLPTLPANEAGAANNFLTAYNSTTGAWTKARPTWANIDKATSSLADITTRSHTALGDIGTNTHATIDSHLADSSDPHGSSMSISSKLFVGDTANTFMTQGLTVNQGAADDEVIALKSSDIAHPVTAYAEEDTYGLIRKYASLAGGLQLVGLSDTDGRGICIDGVIGSNNPADATPAVVLRGFKYDGVNNIEALDEAETILGIHNGTTQVFAMLGSGNIGLLGRVPSSTINIYASKDYADPASNSQQAHWVANLEYTGVETVTEHFYANILDIRSIINTGHYNTGTIYGQYFTGFRNSMAAGSDDSGQLAAVRAMYLAYGHRNTNAGATPTTNVVSGLYFYPYADTGTISTLYDIYIAAGSALGTITNRYSIYQEASAAVNFLGCNTGFGTTSPHSLVDIADDTGGILTLTRDDTSVTAADIIGRIQWRTKDASTTTNVIAAEIEVTAGATIASDVNPGIMKLYATGTAAAAARFECLALSAGTAAQLGFFGVTPVVRPTALTTALTTVTFTAPGTPDYAWGAGTNSSAWGWSTNDEFKSAASVIANLQTRVNELETKLKALGLLT